MFDSRPSSLLALGLIALLSGCGKKEPDPEPVAIPVVMVMASDFAFQMPDTLVAGTTSFRIMNHGQEAHHLALVRLPDGMAMADLQQLNPTAPPPAGLVFAGGPNFAAPGGAVEATLNLEPGRYVAICAIPSPDGVMHMAKGMMKEFFVVPPPDRAQRMAAPPDADVVVQLADYSFTTRPALTAGRHTIKVENSGSQWHEMVLVRLEAGKTIQDMAQWAEKPEGPPPGGPVDGVSPISPGQANAVTVDLSPGEYGFICFLPDTRDGRPHLVHGMIQQFTVK